ncbi:MAG: uncharacterized protein A8A55_2423 [Amphiamblys sp. WSBS2006]|nr:MAG: uncharacterized protein A8A55_2423 [Amphiamblys sp. WSBS2006]
MQNISVFVAALSASVCALSNNFAYVPRDVLPMFQTEQDRDIYVLDEKKQADKLCSVYFVSDARGKSVPSPVSLLRFVYDETEARTRYPNARDIAEEVSSFIAKHAEVDTKRKLFFVSFANGVSPVQAVPEDIAEVSILGPEGNNIDYLYKKEKEHGSHFDSFLITEECKYEDSWKTPRIRNIPGKRREAALLLSFLAKKEFQLYPEAGLSMHGEEGNKWGLKLPYSVGLFVNEENSCFLELFDLTETKIKRLLVSSFDITRMDLKNTQIEELFLVDEAALVFFYDSIENTEFCVERVSFGSRLNQKNEKFLKLIERVHKGETTAPRKTKKLTLNKNSFFWFLEEARRITKRKIHVEDLGVTQTGNDNRPETETRIMIVVTKRISIIGNASAFLYIELGPEISHINIDEIQRQCLSPEIEIPRISVVLTKNKINVRESLYALHFLKKNIATVDVCFLTNSGKKAIKNTKIRLAVGEMEYISFWRKGLSVLSCITNKKINVRYMAVMDTTCFFDREKKEAKKKEFVIRERLYMRNTGIFFLECLGNTVFIPVIEIEVDRCMEYWGGFGKTKGSHTGTNALVENISPDIERAGKMKQKIREMVKQRETVVKIEFGYQKLVFKEDSKHGEQSETEKSGEQPIIKNQELDEFIKEYLGYKEQRESEEPSEQPSIESQAFEVLKEDYSLSEESVEMHLPEESDCFQDEEAPDACWNHLFEGRGQSLCLVGLHDSLRQPGEFGGVFSLFD